MEYILQYIHLNDYPAIKREIWENAYILTVQESHVAADLPSWLPQDQALGTQALEALPTMDQGLPCDLLKPQGCSRSDAVLVPSLSLNARQLLLLRFWEP